MKTYTAMPEGAPKSSCELGVDQCGPLSRWGELPWSVRMGTSDLPAHDVEADTAEEAFEYYLDALAYQPHLFVDVEDYSHTFKSDRPSLARTE